MYLTPDNADNLQLTIGGQPWYIASSSWFYYDGELASLPDWLLDELAEGTAGRSTATGLVVLQHPQQGFPTFEPNSLVFVGPNKTIQSLRGVTCPASTTKSGKS